MPPNRCELCGELIRIGEVATILDRSSGKVAHRICARQAST